MKRSVYAPLGMLGYGFPEESLLAAVEHRPDAIALDAGSMDAGPYYLGSGASITSETMVHRDLSLLLTAARKLDVPLLIGSAGGSGARPHLERTAAVIRRIAREEGLTFRMAVIPGDIPRDLIATAISRGRIVDFEAGYELTLEDLASCRYLVGQMGVEPFLAALKGGADVILAGRAYDAAIAAAVPIEAGIDRGVSLHMGKIVECGSMVALPRESDGVIADIDSSRFEIEPADPAKRCSVDLVAAHTLYEKSDPYILELPGGHLDLHDVVFEEVNSRRVRVRGSRFVEAAEYTVKIEGAALVGYRAVCIAGVRDPVLIGSLDELTDRVTKKIAQNLDGYVDPNDYTVRFRVYGRDGVMGTLEPTPVPIGHELGIVIDVVGTTQEMADSVAALARSVSLHMGYSGRKANAGNLAFPYSPAEFAAPPAYEFRAYHLMKVDDPNDLFPIGWETVDGRK